MEPPLPLPGGPPAPPSVPRAAPLAPPRFGWGAFFVGGLVMLILGVLGGVPLCYHAYRTGKTLGQQRERQRLAAKGAALQSPPLEWHAGDFGPPSPGEAESPAPPGAPAAVEESGGGPWCFDPGNCVRVVWPMELLPRAPGCERPHFRVRQGANRIAPPGTALCEFLFRTDREVELLVFVHARYSDDCGNSLRCSVDGGTSSFLGDTKIFDRWLWDASLRRFRVAPGLHRVTLATCEDGLEFDRVALWPGERPAPAALDALAACAAPEFETVPPASALLPALGPVSAQAFATDSLVMGAGHVNRVVVFLRLNGSQPAEGQAVVRGANGPMLGMREFHLTPGRRVQWLEWKLDLSVLLGESYLVPVAVEVYTPRQRIHAQQFDFIRPLRWAFLGPYPDPRRKGLDLFTEADAHIATLPKLPPLDKPWRFCDDGSCYDAFGVVDLNKVFGRTDERWRGEGDPGSAPPEVAYAVTAARCPPSHHFTLALAGDDCVQAWLNGKYWVRQDGNAPLETTRLVIGAETRAGANYFVFKVPQTSYYWQLLFEPDSSVPYSLPEGLVPLAREEW